MSEIAAASVSAGAARGSAKERTPNGLPLIGLAADYATALDAIIAEFGVALTVDELDYVLTLGYLAMMGDAEMEVDRSHEAIVHFIEDVGSVGSERKALRKAAGLLSFGLGKKGCSIGGLMHTINPLIVEEWASKHKPTNK